ncbi:MAG: primosomal protein N' [Oscillospiraceae bacterium]|nr:primosomal protein N' [Oscillospiraceae bacterium]
MDIHRKPNQNIELLKLSKRANNANLPEVEIVDLRQELVMGNRTMISIKLFNAIQENMKNNQQTILFLNRRGFSTFVMCRECGHTLKCKNCNISLTYHSKENVLKCHYCGYKIKPVTVCPKCGSKKIKYLGTGTQKLETEIQKMFPGVSTIRMDVDTIKKDNTHEDILNKFKEENINILIGTQMVVKGHHFPNVTLVGVIIADSSLNIEDYRATERTFQLLTQVAGRAGRENLPGKVIIQTYNPENYSIIFSQEQDYDKFYKTEINLREQLKYPPFCDIISINIVSDIEKNVEELSAFIYKELVNINLKGKMLIFKPMPSPIDRIKNKIRWRIIIKCKFDNNIIDVLNSILKKCYSLNYKDTGVVVDVNPNSFV